MSGCLDSLGWALWRRRAFCGRLRFGSCVIPDPCGWLGRPARAEVAEMPVCQARRAISDGTVPLGTFASVHSPRDTHFIYVQRAAACPTQRAQRSAQSNDEGLQDEGAAPLVLSSFVVDMMPEDGAADGAVRSPAEVTSSASNAPKKPHPSHPARTRRSTWHHHDELTASLDVSHAGAPRGSGAHRRGLSPPEGRAATQRAEDALPRAAPPAPCA